MLRDARIPCVEGGNLARNPIDMAVGYSSKEAAADGDALPDRSRLSAARLHRRVAQGQRSRARSAARLRGGVQGGGHRRRRRHVHRDRPRPARRRAGDGDAARPPSRRPRGVLLGRRARRRRAVRAAAARPRDSARVAIAGFDDLDIASQVVPALTTLRVPRYEIGRQAGEMICERLAGRPCRARRRHRLRVRPAVDGVTVRPPPGRRHATSSQLASGDPLSCG